MVLKLNQINSINRSRKGKLFKMGYSYTQVTNMYLRLYKYSQHLTLTLIYLCKASYPNTNIPV